MKEFLFLFLVFNLFYLQGQTLQTVKFEILPSNALVKVDNQVIDLSKRNTLDLSPGEYQIEIWAPEFTVLSKTILVKTGETLVVREGLRDLSDSFAAYRLERQQYSNTTLKRNIAGGAVVGFFGAITYVALTGKNKELNRLENLIENRRDAYFSAVSTVDISVFSEQYTNAVTEYEDVEQQHNSVVTLAAAGSILTAAGAFFYFKKKRKSRPEKPLFVPENPFVYQSPRLKPAIQLGSSSSILGFTLKF